MTAPEPRCPVCMSYDLERDGDNPPRPQEIEFDTWQGSTSFSKTVGYLADFRCSECGWTGEREVPAPGSG